eukprot:m.85731 g.85731  ORF g.85731 m.85731 type:complete len:316 (-) comp13522_c0_seq2:37-984(-)
MRTTFLAVLLLLAAFAVHAKSTAKKTSKKLSDEASQHYVSDKALASSSSSSSGTTKKASSVKSHANTDTHLTSTSKKKLTTKLGTKTKTKVKDLKQVKKASAAETALRALKASKTKKIPTHLKGIAARPIATTGRPNPSPPRGGVCRATRNLTSITPVKAKILGPLAHQVGEWIYVQVQVSGEMSDPNIAAACTAAGFVTPCPGGPECYMNNEHCTVTSETGCDYPMRTLASSLCGSGVDPKNCPALAGPGTFAYLGETWACSGCGAVTNPVTNPLDYCELGFGPTSFGKYALCAYHQSHVLNLDGIPAANGFPK